GRKLAFPAIDADGVTRLWVHDFISGQARALPGIRMRIEPPPPFWSPDSRFIAFDGEVGLQKVDLTGGPPQTLWTGPGFAVGGSWNRDDAIIFAGLPQGILRISAAGGTASAVVRNDHGMLTAYPWFLPDGRHFLYLRGFNTPGETEEKGIFVGSI